MISVVAESYLALNRFGLRGSNLNGVLAINLK